MPTPTLWHIPYQRNLYFTGREEVLTQLGRALQADATVALSHPQGISGLGGIGKTQTVIEYAYRHRDEYDAVFWVRADSMSSLVSSMIELAQVLHLPERDEKDQEVIVEAVLRWFQVHINWLLIYDNIEDFSIAERFLPKAGPGHLLFTTRAHSLGGLAQRLEIQQMEPEIGALLLLRRASLLALQATLNAAKPDEQRLAQAISQELDGLPLALDQAGAYIKETPCPLPNYLPRYQTRRGDILRVRGSFDQDYPASVATTWSLSFEKVTQANPAAPELLNFCAFLAPDTIPEEILTAGALYLGAVLAPVAANPLQLDRVCQEVLRFSLLQRAGDERTLTVHRLVQQVLRDSMPPQTQRQWMQRTVYAVEAAYPGWDFVHWPQMERLLPHALTCATWIEQVPLATSQASDLLNQTGHYLSERTRYAEAEPLYQRALAIREQELGATHPDTATSLNNLGNLHRAQRKYEEAEPLLKRALAIREQGLRVIHPDTATSLNNLALLYRVQRRYAEAEPLFLRALAICEQESGATHPNIAKTLDSLATLYDEQGKYEKVEPLYQRALAIREQQELGATHPDTATSLNNLALFYRERGRYAEAEPLYARALAIRERELGATNLHTAQSLNNLAELYRVQGKYAEAEAFFQRALAVCERELGAIHPETATKLNNLAALYYEQERYKEAEPLYARALAICERALGATHPYTASSLNNLALLYKAQRRYEQAEPLLERALAISEQELGATHPDTATSLNNLATLYCEQGRYAEAEPLLERALVICEQVLGATHPQTAGSLNNLALLYKTQGRSAGAEPLFLRALAICEQKLGPIHPDTVNRLNNLAALYCEQGRYEKAEPLLKRTLGIREQTLEASHPDIAASLDDLAVLYSMQGRYREAESLFKRALAIYEQRELGATHSGTADTLNDLAELYCVQERYEEARPLLKRALAIRLQESGAEHPDTVRILTNLRVLDLAQKKFRERSLSMGRDLFRKTFGEDPLQAFEQMVAFMRQQRWAEALKKGQICVDSLLLSSRDGATTFHNMGFCYNELGQYAEAEKQYKEAVLLDSGNSDLSLTLWFNRANNQHQWGNRLLISGKESESQGHFNVALAYALKAREIDPSDNDTQGLIVSIQRSMKTR